MCSKLKWVVSFLILSVVMPQTAVASNNDTTLAEVDVAGLYNPLGLSLSVKTFRRQVYRDDPSPLWNGLYYQAGGQAVITPAFTRAGVHLEWMPVAVMKLRAQLDRLYFSGAFGSLLTFNSASDSFSDKVIESRDGEERTGYGTRSAVQLTLQVKFQSIIVRNLTEQVNYQFPGSGPYYLEREFELLMATDDTLTSNQFYVLYETKQNTTQRLVGPYHSYVSVDKTSNKTERLGITWYQQNNKQFGMLKNTRWYLQAGQYLNDPERDGEFYLLLGVGGDYGY